MAYAIIVKKKTNQQRQIVGRVWARTRDEASTLAVILHPCGDDEEIELRAAD